MLGLPVYDDILAALTVNQLIFENSSSEWEMMHPEKIIQIETDVGTMYIFHTTSESKVVSIANNKITDINFMRSLGVVYVTEEALPESFYKLPPLHGFIKINNTKPLLTLELGDLTIELE